MTERDADEEEALAAYRRMLERALEVVLAAEVEDEPELRPEPLP